MCHPRLILLILLSSARPDHLQAFTFPTIRSSFFQLGWKHHSGLDSSVKNTNDGTLTSKPLNRIETTAVKRFTTRYDKLCKSCPTRLQPRVDTLEEMIMGLPVQERETLLSNIDQRINEGNVSSIQSDEGVYYYQTTGQATEASVDINPPEQVARGVTLESSTSSIPQPEKISKQAKKEKSEDKAKSKMEKSRRKFEKSKADVVRIQRLLDVVDALLAAGKGSQDGDSSSKILFESSPVDNDIYHQIDELRDMSRAELEMERLKILAQKVKFEEKAKKRRMKLYGASLTMTEEQQKSQ